MSPGGGNLGNLTVTFTAQGLAQLQHGISQLQQAFASVGAAANAAGTQGAKFLKALQEAGKGATYAFVGLTGVVGGFVRAGLNASVAGQVIGIQMEMLSREIASLFLPAIQKVTEWLGRAVQWLRSLSGAQQEAIGKALLWTAGLLGIVMIAPRVVAGIQTIGLAVKALMTMLNLAMRTPAGLLLTAIAGIAVAVAYVAVKLFGWQAIFNQLSDLASVLKEIFVGIGEVIASLVDSIADMLGGVLEMLAKVADTMKRLEAKRQGVIQDLGDEHKVVRGLVKIPILGHGMTAMKDMFVGGKLREAEREKDDGKDHKTLGPRLGPITDLDSHWKRIAETTVKVTAGLSGKKPEETTAENTTAMKSILEAILEAERRKRPLLAGG